MSVVLWDLSFYRHLRIVLLTSCGFHLLNIFFFCCGIVLSVQISPVLINISALVFFFFGFCHFSSSVLHFVHGDIFCYGFLVPAGGVEDVCSHG